MYSLFADTVTPNTNKQMWSDIATTMTEPSPWGSWQLTNAIMQLRLATADACLRAREDAQHLPQQSSEYSQMLGRAQGYEQAVAILRGWVQSDHQVTAVSLLEYQAELAATFARLPLEESPEAQQSDANNADYHAAYAWALEFVVSQVHELCANARVVVSVGLSDNHVFLPT